MAENELIYEYLSRKEIDRVEDELAYMTNLDEKLRVLSCLIEIYRAEHTDNANGDVFDYSTDINVLYRWYIETKLYLRRLEFDLGTQSEKQFYQYCKENKVSVYMLARLVLHNIFDKEKVLKKLIRLYIANKGEKSYEVRYFAIQLKRVRDN